MESEEKTEWYATCQCSLLAVLRTNKIITFTRYGTFRPLETMNQSRFACLFTLLLPFLGSELESVASDDRTRRPNIVWITAEDMSAHLGCYGDPYSTTPYIDRLAAESVRYSHAFATAPVCSPARSCLVTGVYATSLGTQRLRSEFPIPEWIRPFPAYLREAGYFTSNNVKTDYNVAQEARVIRDAWDRNAPDAHWRQRKDGQPFFCVFNLMTTHQSRTGVWPFEQFERDIGRLLTSESRHDSSQAPLPPYYPDTDLSRRMVARYYDCITRMDQQVGAILQQLEDDGLAENTIVFFYSDHGMGLPRGKRLLHDSGMHVPLLVRFPEEYTRHAPARAGSVDRRLVSFVDFAPTVLSLAGVKIPDYMQGTVFLGPSAREPRSYVYGARDRVDEAYDLSRSVRDHNYLYIRNYMPHQSWMQPEAFSDQSPMRREFRELLQSERLNAAQLTYAALRRAREELYDSRSDPHQIKNLADSEEHRAILDRFRTRHQAWLLETRDVGFMPEYEMWSALQGDTPWDVGRDQRRYPLSEVLETVSWVGDENHLEDLTSRLAHPHVAVRFWAVLGLRGAKNRANYDEELTILTTSDPAASVRIEAAAALVEAGESRQGLATLEKELRHSDVNVVLRAMRAAELLGKKAAPLEPQIRLVAKRAGALEQEPQDPHPCWMFVRFSAQAWLQNHSSAEAQN